MFRIKDKFNLRNKKLLFLITISLMILFSAFIIIKIINPNSSISGYLSNNLQGTQQKVTEENLASYLSFNSIIQDIPESGLIALKIGGKDYIVRKGNVSPGIAKNPDVSIFVPGKYIKELSNGLCYALSKANKNKELSVELHHSKITLAWKYRALRGYSGCL